MISITAYALDHVVVLTTDRKHFPVPTTSTTIPSSIIHNSSKFNLALLIKLSDQLLSTMMASESSLSASTTRAPLSSTHPPSMADSLPSINFGFDELRDRMARFTARFDDFIEKGRKRVLEERNQFRMNVAELQGTYIYTLSSLPLQLNNQDDRLEDQRMKQKDMEILSLKSATHAQTLQKEAQESAEMEAAIASITSQHDARASHCDRLRTQIEETQKMIKQRTDAQRKHAEQIDAQARFNLPELDFWQSYLCLRIEGAGVEDRLNFVYTHVDERDWEREAWFELGMGSREYEVLRCQPKLEPAVVQPVVERLNESRNIGVFLKEMRELFAGAMKSVG